MKRLMVVLAVIFCCVGSASAAPTTDLTTEGSSATINGAIFMPFNPEEATGTGVFEPFVRIQATGVETGYNTAGEVEFNTKGGTWTHALRVGDVPAVEYEGNWYLEFLLDIDETGGADRFVTLDQMIIRIEDQGNLTGWGTASFTGPIVYDLDFGDDNSVLMDAKLFAGPGNGTGDLRVLVPSTLFAGASEDDFIYLYSVMGERVGSDDGFEEWGTLAGPGEPPPPIPAPGAMVLAGIGVVALGWLRQRKTL